MIKEITIPFGFSWSGPDFVKGKFWLSFNPAWIYLTEKKP